MLRIFFGIHTANAVRMTGKSKKGWIKRHGMILQTGSEEAIRLLPGPHGRIDGNSNATQEIYN